MSRIRSIHPGFFTDEAFVQVSAFARLLLLGLGTEADDKGAFPWKPVSLKIKLFPMDVVDIQQLLKELCEVDAIRRYKLDGKEYGCIRNFRQHQRPKKPNDIHPMPDEYGIYVGLSGGGGEPVGNQWGKTSADGEEGRGGESRGKEGRVEEDGGERRGIRAKAPKWSTIPRPETVALETWGDFEKHRKAKGAPITETAIKGFEREAAKAGLSLEEAITESIERNWQGFKADWIKGAGNGNGNRNTGGSRNGLLDAALEGRRGA